MNIPDTPNGKNGFNMNVPDVSNENDMIISEEKGI
jgi:hypothetical protein